ncbi:MAG: hypothetical protein FJ388_00100 [Verrucomicrobia bacterium]|nr:hypothetical protein [Verrucomicrobiota bacterium]
MNTPLNTCPSSESINRRDFLATAALAAAAPPAATEVSGRNEGGPAAVKAPSQPGATLPKGKIGDLELSRLMLGTNHITFYMHSRDLRYVDNLSRHYNTDEKIIETFFVAEANGVNTFVTHSEAKIEKLFQEYRNRRGGKMKWLVAPWISSEGIVTDLAGYNRTVPPLVDSGVDALYVPGMLAGPLVNQGKSALIGEMLNIIKASGLPAGVASHGLDVIQFCEKEKLPVDFYVKTFHHLKYPSAPKPEEIAKLRQSAERYPRGDLKADYAEVPGYWCGNPEETTEFMKSVAKPWIAFKVMAAGAIPPQNAFQYAYGNGADFILAGMFDFQIAEDAQIASNVIAALKTRPRPWRG